MHEEKKIVPISEITAALHGHLNGDPDSKPIAALVEAVAEYPRDVRDNFASVVNSIQGWQSRAAEAPPSQRSAYAAGREAVERRIAAFETHAEVTMLRQKITS